MKGVVLEGYGTKHSDNFL